MFVKETLDVQNAVLLELKTERVGGSDSRGGVLGSFDASFGSPIREEPHVDATTK